VTNYPAGWYLDYKDKKLTISILKLRGTDAALVGEYGQRMTSKVSAAWLRLFQSGKTTQAPKALEAAGLLEPISQTFWSGDEFLAAYADAALNGLRTIAVDGHGRPPSFPKPGAGLVSHTKLISPQTHAPNLICRTLIIGACFQGTDGYLPTWQEAFPNAVIIAAEGEVPDGVADGCALIANLIKLSLADEHVSIDDFTAEIREMEMKNAVILEAGFSVFPPKIFAAG